MRSLYGTRDASRNWEAVWAKLLTNLQFILGTFSICVLFNVERQLFVFVHGDDFINLGKNKEVEWLKQEMSKELMVKETARLGPLRSDDKDVICLNRIISLVERDGLIEVEYECGERGTITIDSGAGVSVWPRGRLPGVAVDRSVKAVEMTAANGTKIPHYVRKVVRFKGIKTGFRGQA